MADKGRHAAGGDPGRGDEDSGKGGGDRGKGGGDRGKGGGQGGGQGGGAPEDGAPALVRKLGIRPGHVVALVGAPPRWTVSSLPTGARVRRSLGTGADVVMAFVRRAAELDPVTASVTAVLGPDDALWILWPRRAAGHLSDVTERIVRASVLPTGLVDVKVAAVGEDWSGLRFVWRRTVRSVRRRPAR